MPTSSSPSNQRALIYALAAVGLWSTMATAFKWALEFNTPMALITLAATVSWCFFGVRVIGAGSLNSMREMKSALLLRLSLIHI